MSGKRDVVGNIGENRIRTVEVVPLTTTVEIADVIVVENPSLGVGVGVSVVSGVSGIEEVSVIEVEVGRVEDCEDSDVDDVESDEEVDVEVVVVVV